MIAASIRKKIFEKVISIQEYNLNDLTWRRKDAIALIKSLMDDDIGIWGGDVWSFENNRIVPTYDNWYINPFHNETRADFIKRSKMYTLNYIEQYTVPEGANLLFGIVFTDDVFWLLEDKVNTIHSIIEED